MAERGRPRSFDKDAALAKAMELFWDKGYEGASLADLTATMGIAPPSLYAAFGSKEELFRQALALYGRVEGGEIWGAVESASTAYGAAEAFLMETARVFTRPRRPTGCLVVLSALHAGEISPTVRAELVAMRAKTCEDMAQRFRAGQARGEVSASADPAAMARYYVTVQQGMSIQARDGAGRTELESIARSALSAWPALAHP